MWLKPTANPYLINGNLQGVTSRLGVAGRGGEAGLLIVSSPSTLRLCLKTSCPDVLVSSLVISLECVVLSFFFLRLKTEKPDLIC